MSQIAGFTTPAVTNTPVFIEPSPWMGRVGFKVNCNCHPPVQVVTMAIGAPREGFPSERKLCAKVLKALPVHDGLSSHIYVQLEERWYEDIEGNLYELVDHPVWGRPGDDSESEGENHA